VWRQEEWSMLALGVRLASFATAYAAWRWGLGSRNWFEGCFVSLLFAIFAGLLTQAAQRILSMTG
jgi:hypothetical protein